MYSFCFLINKSRLGYYLLKIFNQTDVTFRLYLLSNFSLTLNSTDETKIVELNWIFFWKLPTMTQCYICIGMKTKIFRWHRPFLSHKKWKKGTWINGISTCYFSSNIFYLKLLVNKTKLSRCQKSSEVRM